MTTLAIEVLRLFITFLQQVLTLLEARLPGPAPLGSEEPRPLENLHLAQLATQTSTLSLANTEVPSDDEQPTPEPQEDTWALPTRAERRRQQEQRQNQPTSPSAWRRPRVSNAQLRAEYESTRVCGHYWHETPRPRLPACPICERSS